jgi:hypothetical protein
MSAYNLRSGSLEQQGDPVVAEASKRMRKAKKRVLEEQHLEALRQAARRKKAQGPKSAEELLNLLAQSTDDSGDVAILRDRADLVRQFQLNIEANVIKSLDKQRGDEQLDDEPECDPTAFIALKDYIDERLMATGKGQGPVDQVLRLVGCETVPIPLDFSNLQVGLDARWWVIVWEEGRLTWEDLMSKFKKRAEGGRLRREFETSLREALTMDITETLSTEAELALERLVGLHVTLAVHWLHSESAITPSEFLLRWDNVVRMCEKEATVVFQDFCVRCGVSGADFTVGQKLSRGTGYAGFGLTVLTARALHRFTAVNSVRGWRLSGRTVVYDTVRCGAVALGVPMAR